eukprot:c19063_g1_i1.p1 GENE.c19063_g1_i1~~c19063_g1_i1.p1  ORF type:complete len:682 (+),score=274.47 c19063_g1_i1:51-2096(+)
MMKSFVYCFCVLFCFYGLILGDTEADIAARTNIPKYVSYIGNYSATHWEPSSLWPLPSSYVHGDTDVWICNSSFTRTINIPSSPISDARDMIESALSRYSDNYFFGKDPANCVIPQAQPSITSLTVDVLSANDDLQIDTDESYNLTIQGREIRIISNTVFGALHGIETLSQLIFPNTTQSFVIKRLPWSISDKPRMPWRGLMLDVSRTWIPVSYVLHLLETMSFSKMNVLHLHISDSQTFPIEVKSYPDIANGYGDDLYYTHEDVLLMIKKAKYFGVRLVPEFDTPGHARSWHGKTQQYRNITVCDEIEPWTNFCAEPPCGQLNPTVELTYTIVEGVYNEMSELFPDSFFHVGGDEISTACWNSSAQIRAYLEANPNENFVTLGQKFLTRREQILGAAKKTIIAWDDILAHNVSQDTVIQFWQPDINHLKTAVQRGHRVILSDASQLYLDCGTGDWLAGRVSWCEPYKTWESIYNYEPTGISVLTPDVQHLVLGGEAAMWSEQSDATMLDSRLWPRASALAERFWSPQPILNNANRITQDQMFFAYKRMIVHRERLVARGVAAMVVQLEWCKSTIKGFCWCPCTCNVTDNEIYGGPNEFDFPACSPGCQDEVPPTPTSAPTSTPTITSTYSNNDSKSSILSEDTVQVCVIGILVICSIHFLFSVAVFRRAPKRELSHFSRL